MAKDLNLKSREVADMLSARGIEGKTTSAVLSSDEFSVLFDELTRQNQVESIDAYLQGDYVIDVPQPAPKSAKPAAKADAVSDAAKADAAQGDAAKADAAQGDAAKADAAQDNAVKADAAQSDAVKADAAQSDAAKADTAQGDADKADAAQGDADKVDAAQGDADKADTAQGDADKADTAQGDAVKADTAQGDAVKADAAQDNAAQNASGGARPMGQGGVSGSARPMGQGGVSGSARPMGQGGTPAPGTIIKRGQSASPAPGTIIKRGQSVSPAPGTIIKRGQSASPAAQQGQTQRPATPQQGQRPAPQSQNQNQNQRPAQGQAQTQRPVTPPVREERPAKPRVSEEELRRRRQEQKLQQFSKGPAAPQQKQKPQRPKPQAQPQQPLFASRPADSGQEPVLVTEDTRLNRRQRIVDTRTTQIDLSRYDGKADNLVPDDARELAGAKQKLKKQNNRGERGERERAAIEKLRKQEAEKAKKVQLAVSLPDEITVGELASRLKITAGDAVKRLMKLGVMATVNETVDFDTAYLIADELGAKVTREVVVTIEDKLFDDSADKEEDLVPRAPVVVVMGHVDHGKTSILDRIRNTHVTAGEAGGITQHIGAYRVNVNGQDITFLDTPGHEAFTAMRARGAKATDIAILVVAADDGIMPQTVEAINHAKQAGLEIVVAINKMDKPGADPDRIKQDLTKYDLVPEEWGGSVICVPVSALTGQGMDDLLENVLLVAEMKELRANPNRRAKGIVIEARLDKGRGPVATVLVQNGTLNTGDVVIAGTAVGHVRLMTDDKGRALKSAGPSVPVEIVGLAEVPSAGDEFNAVEDERMARELAEQRREKQKEEQFRANAKMSLDQLFDRISEGTKELKIIVKADVGGSAEAVKASLVKLSNDEVKVNVIHAAAGGITEGDVMFASASDAIIVGFNVRPDKAALDSAERQKVEIRTYRIIYECIEEITAAMKGMLAPTYKENLLGRAEVRQTIHVPNVGTIAGCYVQDGKLTRSAQIRVLRDGIVIFEDKVSSLRRFKDDVREVASGYECGVGLDRFNDIKVGDILEAFEMVEVER